MPGCEHGVILSRGRFSVARLPNGGTRDLDLTSDQGQFHIHWFNPRTGDALTPSGITPGGNPATLTAPDNNDWLAVIRKR